MDLFSHVGRDDWFCVHVFLSILSFVYVQSKFLLFMFCSFWVYVHVGWGGGGRRVTQGVNTMKMDKFLMQYMK